MSNVADTLIERGKRYGPFIEHAICTQQIKRVMGMNVGWHRLASDQREALEMIAHKIGRILCGDPNYADSWHDIAGYAKLVEDRLGGVDSNAPAVVEKQTTITFPEAHESFGGTE